MAQFDGFISEERLSDRNDGASLWLKIRVPTEHFDVLIKSLSKEAGRIDERSTEIEDVTDQYCDLSTRLAVYAADRRYSDLPQTAEAKEQFYSTHGRACLKMSFPSAVILNSTSMAKSGFSKVSG
ncbi:MAG: DUF4349 domain-containing protein [Pontiellaceae bacterium]|nr:DUF4349 domain-containing protein [Pontiellaceae bacterium]MBN2784611.1 DUF4349 domain-containing protein [Pontiellaceae bacterium]